MRILIACECSGAVRRAFRARGHDAWSCDLQPADDGDEHHIQGDVLPHLLQYGGKVWDMMIAFPDCTYLTVTANKWLKDQPPRKSGALVGQARRDARTKAVEFFMKLANAPMPKKVIENPVGVMSRLFRKPDQIITPNQFGHSEPKKTCLWLENLPKLKPTKNVMPEYHITKSGKRLPKWYAYADKSKGQAARAKIRAATFLGIAEAMAEQWGQM